MGKAKKAWFKWPNGQIQRIYVYRDFFVDGKKWHRATMGRKSFVVKDEEYGNTWSFSKESLCKCEPMTEEEMREWERESERKSSETHIELPFLRNASVKAWLEANCNDFGIESVKDDLTFGRLDALLHSGVSFSEAATGRKGGLDTAVRELICSGLASAFGRSVGYYTSLWRKNVEPVEVNLPEELPNEPMASFEA